MNPLGSEHDARRGGDAGDAAVRFVIPLFNEAKNVAGVVDGIAQQLGARPWTILAVDDGSTDDTRAVIDALARDRPQRLQAISHARNLGVPDALWTGYAAAAAAARDGDFIVCAEGDGTSDPAALGEMLARLRAGCDIVIPSRFVKGGGWSGFPFHRKVISRVGNGLLGFLFPYPGITDFTIFYRGYRAAFLKNVIARQGRAAFGGRHFSANVSLLLACLPERPRVAEVPHVYCYGCKKSRSAFRVGAAVLAYFQLAATVGVVRLRALCRAERRRQTPSA
jgi:dolichol-phosphate mannosyltransferase